MSKVGDFIVRIGSVDIKKIIIIINEVPHISYAYFNAYNYITIRLIYFMDIFSK